MVKPALEARRTSGLEPEQIIDAVDQPAFIVDANGSVLHANRLAKLCFPRRPAWVKTCFEGREPSGVPSWIHRVPLRFQGRRLWLLFVSHQNMDPEGTSQSEWALRWRLSPRLARVAALVAQGLSDKEIAERLGLRWHTARTYVKQLLTRAKVHSRTELICAILNPAGQFGEVSPERTAR